MNRKTGLFIALITSVLLACACGPNIKQVRAVVSGYDKKRIAVMPFKDLPTDPNSGEAAQARLCQKLSDAGFILVNRADLDKILTEQKVQTSGVVDPSQAATLGKLSGADVVMTGVVGEASIVSVRKPPVYATEYRPYVLPDGTIAQQAVQVMTVPETMAYEAHYSISVTFTSLETGQIVWSGSESSIVYGGTIEEAAQSASDKIIRRLYKDIVKAAEPQHN